MLAVLAGYFTYQWWFNPQRAIKRQLSGLAAALSAPAGDRQDLNRVARVAGLRKYLTPDVHVRTGVSGPELTSRDAVIGAVTAWNPSADGWNVDFVDVQITLDSASKAHASMSVEITTSDPRTGTRSIDGRDALVEMARRDGTWVVATAQPIEPLPHP